MNILPLLRHVFIDLKGLFLYHFSVFLCFSSCTQQHFTLRLAPKYTAFSTKIHCIQHQNALHLAAYCTTFCCKQHIVWCKLQFYATWIHLARIYNKPHFAPKQTFARIDYLRQGGRLVDGKGTHNVKIPTKNYTKTILPRTRAWSTSGKTLRLTTDSAVRVII